MLTRTKVSLVAVAVLFVHLFPPVGAVAQDTCDGQTPTQTGTEGDDTLLGTPGDDIIVGLGGNDSIDGQGGNDSLCAGPGDDTLTTVAGEHPATIALDAGLGQDDVFVALGSSSTDPSPQGSGTLQINVAADGSDTVTVEAKPPGGVVGDPAPLSESIDGFALRIGTVDEVDADRTSPTTTTARGVVDLGPGLGTTWQFFVGVFMPPSSENTIIIGAFELPPDFSDVEVQGGEGPDRITGTPQNDRIFGNGSGDRIDGGGGAGNELDGGTGTDRCGRGSFAGCERTLAGAPLGRITAQISPPKTFYFASFLEDGGGRRWQYDWSKTKVSCGRFRGGRPDPNDAFWKHPQGPRPFGCPHNSRSHPGDIVVKVTDHKGWIVKCTYKGSLSGEGPPCTVVKRGR